MFEFEIGSDSGQDAKFSEQNFFARISTLLMYVTMVSLGILVPVTCGISVLCVGEWPEEGATWPNYLGFAALMLGMLAIGGVTVGGFTHHISSELASFRFCLIVVLSLITGTTVLTFLFIALGVSKWLLVAVVALMLLSAIASIPLGILGNIVQADEQRRAARNKKNAEQRA